MTFPTQKVVEQCLINLFPGQGLQYGCLDQSVSTIGNMPESHHSPGSYGFLQCPVNEITGVDIPILVINGEKKEKTIAIVAQDPLRDSNDGMLRPFSPFPQPIVGTPFAFHYTPECYKQTEVYRNIIHGLLKKGYNVYITDIWKCWDKSKNTRGGRWGNKNPHFECLVQEINMIKPDYVILMGNQAQTKFNSIKFNLQLDMDKKLIPVPHPSASANGAWAKIINEKNGPKEKVCSQSKVDYIMAKVP